MAIYKAKVTSKFSVIPNSTLQDENLSFEATGLLAMMLSLPDDWEIRKSWLKDQKKRCGRDKLTTMMKELVEAGYVRKEVKQKDNGRMDGVDWFVHSEPLKTKDSTEELKTRHSVSAHNGKADTTKETENTKETEYINTLSEMDSDAAEVLEHLNEVSNQKMKATTKSHIGHIKARLRDGHTVEDCKRVIEFKHRDWLGTEYYQYMVPKTIFSPAKFDGYLTGAKLEAEMMAYRQ